MLSKTFLALLFLGASGKTQLEEGILQNSGKRTGHLGGI